MYCRRRRGRPATGGPDHAAHRRYAPGTGDGEGPRGAQSGAPLRRARAGHGGAGAFSRDQAGPRSGHRLRFLLRLSIAKSPSRPKIWRLLKRRWPRWLRATNRSSTNLHPRDKSLEDFERDGDFMKTHFVTKFTVPGDEVSFYRNGKFVDFCRGPHVPSTGPRQGRQS